MLGGIVAGKVIGWIAKKILGIAGKNPEETLVGKVVTRLIPDKQGQERFFAELSYFFSFDLKVMCDSGHLSFIFFSCLNALILSTMFLATSISCSNRIFINSFSVCGHNDK